MISFVVWIGRQRRSFVLRRHSRVSHRRIGREARVLLLPFGDYHFARTQSSRIKIHIRRIKANRP